MVKIKTTCLVATALLISLSSAGLSAYAAATTVQELEETKAVNVQLTDPNKILNKNHWAYKTLENVSRKYGLLIGQPGDKFDGTKPLTRSEAAILLINLNGKIEQDSIVLSEAEKAQMDILRQEFNSEINKLTGRVDALEDSVDALKGSISKLEKSNSSALKTDYGEKFKFTGGIIARYSGLVNKGDDDSVPNFNFPLVDLGFNGKLNKYLDYRAGIFPSRNYDGTTKSIMGDAYVSTGIIPHHTIYLGQTRVPIGYEGAMSPYSTDTANIAMIARKYANYRDLGIKVAGNWKYVDYYAGVYNGAKNNAPELNTDVDLMGWATFKPLAAFPQYGSLELGGGYAFGNPSVKYNLYSSYAGYKYKKYAIRSEYAFSDDSLGLNTNSKGWYIHNSYDLTKKIQLVARYDWFDPSALIRKDINQEYTAGINYLFDKQNIKLILDYVHRESGVGKRSGDKIVVQTQYKF